MIATWTPTNPDDRLIASGTNPWVQVDGKAVDWTVTDIDQVDPGNDCDTCAGCIIPGVIEGMDTVDGIQCCGSCKRFPGDLEAAYALAELVGGTVHFLVEGWTVRVWGTGWATIGDKFPTEAAATAFMESLIPWRNDGSTGLDVVHASEEEY